MGLWPSTRLGKYTLLKQLATGGMAELFLARAEGIEGFSKLVVLKRILPHRAADAKYVRMFLAEARLVATLDHPNIAHVYDIGIEDNEYFFAMEFVHGQDVRRILQRSPERRLRIEHALHIATGLCAGLHFAHEARSADGSSLAIVHRDVSPHNVLVSYDGMVKLVDFGVAKVATGSGETREGMIKGKYGYLSPEQALAEPLDRRSDVFAIGILLWEMTVGRRLYKINGELATLQRIVYADAPRPSKLVAHYPPDLEQIVMKALNRARDERYQTAQELQVDLELYAANHRLVVSSVSMSQEMQQIFAPQIEAWRQAERAGLSLADHVVELVTDDDVISESSSEREGPELSDVLDALGGVGPETQVGVKHPPAAAPLPSFGSPPDSGPARHPVSSPAMSVRPSHPAQSNPALAVVRASANMTAARAPRAEPRRWPIALVGLVLVAAGVSYMVWRRDNSPATRPIADHAGSDAAVVAVAVASEESATADAPAADPRSAADPGSAAAPTPEPVAIAAVDHVDDHPDANTEDVPKQKTVKRPVVRHPGRHPTKQSDTPINVVDDPEDHTPAPEKQPPVDTKPAGSGAPHAGSDTAHAGSAAPAGPAPGTMDATKVRTVVRAHLGEVSTCVERARMDDRDLTGKITVRIDVANSGQVTRARVTASTVENHGLEDCLVRAISSWSFPAPAGGVAAAFSYPFTF